MRWDKFTEFTAKHLDLGPCINTLVLPPTLSWGGTHSEFTLRTWVERQVEYIAVRPYDTLNLHATDLMTPQRTESYSCWFHIAGEEQSYARARFANSDGPGTTVMQLMDGLRAWHGEYWAKQPDRPLVFGAVVRQVKKFDSVNKHYRTSLEIYLAPRI